MAAKKSIIGAVGALGDKIAPGNKKKRASKARKSLAGASSPLPIIGSSWKRMVVVAIVWALCMMFAAPFFVFVLCAFKFDPANAGAMVGMYASEHILDGWFVVSQFPMWQTPAKLVCMMMLALGLFAEAYVAYTGATSTTFDNDILGPKVSSSNEKGSARLYTNELMLADIVETWDGDWANPPKKPGLVLGYSEKWGIYYFSPAETHSFLLGLPGAGKTTKVLQPTIEAFAAAGCSMVITDPKGELYNAFGAQLREKGIPTVVFDFRNPLRSNCINIMDPVIDAFEESHAIYEEWARKALSILSAHPGLHADKAVQKSSWGGNEEEYYAYIDAMQKAEFYHKKAWSDASEFSLDLATAIIPERPDAGGAAHWETVGRECLNAMILYVCCYVESDYIGADGKPYAAPDRTQRTLETVLHILQTHSSIDNKGRRELIEMMESIDREHPAYTALSLMRASDDREYKITITETIKFLRGILSDAINPILNKSDVDVATLGERQAVIFVVLPDDRPAVGKIFSAFATTMYSALIRRSARYGNKLPVPVQFLLEEFGNITSPIPAFPNKLAMSRGYNIFFHLILQGMNQLVPIYGDVAQTDIFDKCGVRALIQTTDVKGCGKYFSDAMGTYTYTKRSSNKSRSLFALFDDKAGETVHEEERLLMDPAEVTKWDPEMGMICLLSKPGKEPGWIARQLFGYKSMQPCVFPTAYSWDMPTGANMDIGDREYMQKKAIEADAEERLSNRIPNIAWNSTYLSAVERAEVRTALQKGGVSPHAMRTFERFASAASLEEDVRARVEDNISMARLEEEREAYIDEFTDALIAAMRREMAKACAENAAKSDKFDKEKAAKGDRLALASARGLIYTIMAGKLAEIDEKAEARALEAAAVQEEPAETGCRGEEEPACIDGAWRCDCGTLNPPGNFCGMCGTPRPEAMWTCSCGCECDSNFCGRCGAARPDAQGAATMPIPAVRHEERAAEDEPGDAYDGLDTIVADEAAMPEEIASPDPEPQGGEGGEPAVDSEIEDLYFSEPEEEEPAEEKKMGLDDIRSALTEARTKSNDLFEFMNRASELKVSIRMQNNDLLYRPYGAPNEVSAKTLGEKWHAASLKEHFARKAAQAAKKEQKPARKPAAKKKAVKAPEESQQGLLTEKEFYGRACFLLKGRIDNFPELERQMASKGASFAQIYAEHPGLVVQGDDGKPRLLINDLISLLEEDGYELSLKKRKAS